MLTLLFPVRSLAAAVVDLALWLRRRKHWMGVRLLAWRGGSSFGELQRAGLAARHLAGRRGGPFGRRLTARTAGSTTCACSGSAQPPGGDRVGCSGCASRSRASTTPRPAPAVIMMRHASIIDNTLPDAARRPRRTASGCAS